MTSRPRVVKANRRNLLINLGLLAVSSLSALALCEVGLRVLGRGPLYVSPERAQFWKYDSLLGWAHQPGQQGVFETRQFRTEVRINQAGLRDREHAYARPADTERILVLGDSFAWGYGVEENERFSQLLESALNVEVINAGVSGYSTDQELLWLENEGVKYDFDLVILAFTGNDVGDNERDLVNTIYRKPRFVRTNGQLVLTGTPVAQTSRQDQLIYLLSQRSALAYFMVLRYFDLRSLYHNFRPGSEVANNTAAVAAGVPSDAYEPTLDLLVEISRIAETKQAKFMIVATDRWWNGSSDENYRGLLDTMQSDGYLVLDVENRPGFDAETMLIPSDGHWSRAGHQFVAGQIETLIDSQQLLAGR
jgi:lysophospholipase L1-like esterase